MARDKVMTVQVSELAFDYLIYPRHAIDSHHVREFADTMRAGTEFPSIVVENKTRRIVDGFHRVKATQSVYGDNATITAILRNYPTDKALFLDAAHINSAHGKRLASFDISHCLQIAHRLKIKDEEMAITLSISVDRLAKVQLTKTAFGPNGQPFPIRRSIGHVGQQRLTKKQYAGADLMGGQSQVYCVNQVINAIEYNLCPMNNPHFLERLEVLRNLLVAFHFEQAA